MKPFRFFFVFPGKILKWKIMSIEHLAWSKIMILKIHETVFLTNWSNVWKELWFNIWKAEFSKLVSSQRLEEKSEIEKKIYLGLPFNMKNLNETYSIFSSLHIPIMRVLKKKEEKKRTVVSWKFQEISDHSERNPHWFF